jgi:formylglycine-generating enzyme required for sulfatase activity
MSARLLVLLAVLGSAGCVYDWDSVRLVVPDAGLDGESLDSRPPDTRPDQTRPQKVTPCFHPNIVAKCQNGECFIPAGCFVMGSPKNENCREPTLTYGSTKVKMIETYHSVALTHGFWIGEHEVTLRDFSKLMGYRTTDSTHKECSTTAHPNYKPGDPIACVEDDCPAVCLTWHEAQAYCNALSNPADRCFDCASLKHFTLCAVKSKYSGQSIYDCPGYRLPTEAEWEYSYRAGSHTAFYPSHGNDGTISDCKGKDPNLEKIGWYEQNSGGQTHGVGLKAPNNWGLFDMSGNALEWCHDWHTTDLGNDHEIDPTGSPWNQNGKVTRGGSLFEYPELARAAFRRFTSVDKVHFTLGFRCVRSVIAP